MYDYLMKGLVQSDINKSLDDLLIASFTAFAPVVLVAAAVLITSFAPPTILPAGLFILVITPVHPAVTIASAIV